MASGIVVTAALNRFAISSVLICTVTYLCSVPGVHCFFPTSTPVLPFSSGSQTHQDMVEEANRRIAVNITVGNPTIYPNPRLTLRSSSYRRAIRQFRTAIAEPDFQEYGVPNAHFDSEHIAGGVARLVQFRVNAISEIRSSAFSDARHIFGRALHTLQDFYSHSNWIEMGNNDPYPELGLKSISNDQVATVSQETCVSCLAGGTWPFTCFQNIIDDINNKKLLTTGYTAPISDLLTATKPTGKCSHGGINDATSIREPFGGINKDGLNPLFSPHYYLHQSAASVALQSTIDFFEAVRLAVANTDGSGTFSDSYFAEFLGVPAAATSLCLIVDTSSSMSTVLSAVRTAAVHITTAAVSSTTAQPFKDFVLVQFDEQGYGPAFTTRNSTEMISAVNALNVTSDQVNSSSSFAFSSFKLALGNVSDGSTCYVFLDSPAQDVFLYPEVLSLAYAKDVKFVMFYVTSDTATAAGRRKRRSMARRQRRSAAAALFSYYDDLCRMTSGLLLDSSPAELDAAAIAVFTLRTKPLQVTLFRADNKLDESLSFYVDISTTDVVLQLYGTSSSSSIVFTSPKGVQYTNYSILTNLSNLKIYNVGASLETGLWRVDVSNGRLLYSAVVTATSVVTFGYQFSLLQSVLHGGYEAITGSPLSDKPYFIIADVDGAFDPITQQSTHLLSDVTAVLLLDLTGNVDKRLETFEMKSQKEYAAVSLLPRTGFRVALEGKDTANNVIQRCDEYIVNVVTGVAGRSGGGGGLNPYALAVVISLYGWLMTSYDWLCD